MKINEEYTYTLVLTQAELRKLKQVANSALANPTSPHIRSFAGALYDKIDDVED